MSKALAVGPMNLIPSDSCSKLATVAAAIAAFFVLLDDHKPFA